MSNASSPSASHGLYQGAATLSKLNADLMNGSQDWTSVSECPVCSSHLIRLFALIRQFRYSRCTACGLVFANPVPPDEVLNAFYNSAYYANYRYLEQNMQQRDRYYTMSAYTDIRDLARWLTSIKPESVLDFGCGTGNFLALLRDEFNVPNVYGLELNKTSVEIAKRNYGLEIKATTDQLDRDQYDAAALLEVIEHIPDVRTVIDEVSRLVRPGGFLLLTTPAVDGFVARRMPTQCAHYTGPSHVTLFTEPSLRRLLALADFEPVEIRRDPAPMAIWPALISFFYDLDFASPTHDEDANDAWWRPTRLGRYLGCAEGRYPRAPLHLGGAARITESVLSRFRRPTCKPDHFYVLARRLPDANLETLGD